VDGQVVDANGLLTMDLTKLKAAFSSTTAHGVVKFTGVNYVFGTPWADTLYAGNGIDAFRGQGGNDTFYGDAYINLSSYRSSTNAIDVKLAQGTVTDRSGGTSQGTDTLRGVESIEGTRFDDVFDATGFSETSTNAGGTAAGWKGMVNYFTPMGGNDTVTGNGYTRLSFTQAMLGIEADLGRGFVDSLASDTATRSTPDYLHTVGRTTFTGVYVVSGTDFGDRLIGGSSTASFGNIFLEAFEPRGGADTVDGLGGYDVVFYGSSPNPILVDLTRATGQVMDDGWGSSDTLVNIERVEGSHWNDSLRGNDANNDFRGNRGSDSIDGSGGHDEVSYGASRLKDATGIGGVVVDLGGTARSTVVPTSKPAILPAGYTGWAKDNWGDVDFLKDIEGVQGSDWDDVLIGSDSDNRLDGQQGADTIDGAGGTDWAEYNNAEAGVVVDLAVGEATNDGAGYRDILRNIENVQGSIFNDIISGDAGPNELVGEAGNDVLSGNSGDDTVFGGPGNDTLNGGSGNDRLDGGSGTDTALFSGSFADYSISFDISSRIATVNAKSSASATAKNDGKDVIGFDVELMQFADRTLTLADLQPGWGDTTPPKLKSSTQVTSTKAVPVSSNLSLTFDEAVQRGSGDIVLKTASGSVVEIFNSQSARVSISGSTLTVDPTANLAVFAPYVLEVSPGAVRDQVGNPLASEASLAFRTATRDDLYHFFVVAFAAAPGVTYMGQLADALNFGLGVEQIVEIFTTKPQFTGVYPSSLSNRELATQLVNNIVKNSASAAIKQSAIDDIETVLGSGIGWSRGKMLFTVFGNLANKPLSDPVWGATAKQFQNQLTVARYFTEEMGVATEDLSTLRGVISNVTSDTDLSTPDKIVQIIGTVPPGG
jgi:Ca2+-binding RTX toxin-like protein